MVFTNLGRIFAGLALLLSMFGLPGCATVKPDTAEEQVKEKAQARWEALLKGDFKAAYGFLSPGSRAVLTQEGYASSLRAGFWKTARVDKVVCATADTCEAQVTIEYQFQGRLTKTPLGETWIREGSDWWYLQK